MGLKVEKTVQEDVHTVAVHGEVDLYSSPKLREAVLSASLAATHSVRVDLSAVTYMDSSGVATLVEALRACNGRSIPFVLQAPSHAVMKVLQLSRLDAVFSIEGHCEDA